MINQTGEQLGVMPVAEAIRIAEAAGLDLVEVSPKANPPVCKIMDYGRFKYEKSKQAKAAKKHQATVSVKEIKLRPKIDVHDLNVKIRRLERFLEEGHKVRLSVVFRGREIVHPETGQLVLQKVVDEMGDKLDIDHMPVMEGRRMVMSVSPKPGATKKKSNKTAEDGGAAPVEGKGADQSPSPDEGGAKH